MVVASSIRPYNYVGPKPFSGSGIGLIGLSGILFEQAMFAALAEQDIYQEQSGAQRPFTKYINKGALITQLFEPKNDGSNLTGQSTESSGIKANVNFKNYFIDMRSRVSGIFSLIASDNPYSAEEIKNDYFLRYFGDNPSGTVGNWIHSVSNLSERGRPYDIDLREVMYQPYIRISKYDVSNMSGTTFAVRPIGPSFCSANGNLVTVTERDLSFAANVDEASLFAYLAAASNTLIVAGDIFEVNNSKLYIALTQNSLVSASTGTCTSVAPRLLLNGALESVLGSGFGFFSVPTTSADTGIYSIQTFNNNPIIEEQYSAKSGQVGIWPPLSALNTSGYSRATLPDGSNEVFSSGFHIFNTAFWQFNPSGARLQSPINGQALWQRFAENTTWSTTDYGPKNWSNNSSTPALPIVGANSNLVFYVGMTTDINPDIIIADRRFVFARYSPTNFNLIGGYEEANSIPAPNSPPSVDKFFFIYDHTPPSGVNFSNYYCISEVGTLSSGPEIYILNSSLENVGAWDNNTSAAAAPICMINGHLYGFDPNQVSSSGSTFTWQHNVFADPGAVFPMSPASASVVDIAVHVYETRDTVYDNTGNLSNLFEPINPNNFSFGGVPYCLDPRGSDLDDGDGSIFVRFSAKMKGETVLKSFLGRIKEGTVGGNNVIMITDFKVLKDGTPNWIYSIV